MNMLFIQISNICNYDCDYCSGVAREKRVQFYSKSNGEKQELDAHVLLEYIDKYFNPQDWFIVITGGEPTIYSQRDYFFNALYERGYWGQVFSNGTNPIPENPRWNILSTWHQGKPFPTIHNKIKILQNPDDTWEEKEEYCKKNNIEYIVQPFTQFTKDGPIDIKELNKFRYNENIQWCKDNNIKYNFKTAEELDKSFNERLAAGLEKEACCLYMCFINNLGQVLTCYDGVPNPDISIYNMSEPPIIYVQQYCHYCPAAGFLEPLLPEELQIKFKQDYENDILRKQQPQQMIIPQKPQEGYIDREHTKSLINKLLQL